MMKRFCIPVLAFALAIMHSCTDFQEEPAPASFSVDSKELSFSSNASILSTIVSSGKSWDIPSKPDWISVQSITTYGLYQWAVSFSASENKNYIREGTIVIKTSDESVDITVKQDGNKGEYVPVSSVSLSTTELSLTEGDTYNLVATIIPYNASEKTVTWSSSNTSVATVSSSGIVTAESVGSSVITVRTDDGGKTATCAVTVSAKVINVTSVSLDKTSLTMTEGDIQTLTATVLPSDATDKSVTWSSSNTSVATVSSTGEVIAKAPGAATITVTTTDGSKTASCMVTVKAKIINVTGVTLDKSSLSMVEGETYALTATVSPSDATDKSVTWSSSNTSVATVSSTGEVIAKAPGAATITVTTTDGSKTASCMVTVKAKIINVTGVTLDKSSLSMVEGETHTLTATVSPSNASDKSVTWSSSNTSVATVSSSGQVTAKVAGSTTITVKTNDGDKTAACYVNVQPSTGVENGHEWVDLGLSVKWASINYGATNDSQVGGYFKWGDPSGEAFFINYSMPEVNSICGTKYDIVRKNWGGDWRVPTSSEIKELYNRCSWEWIKKNGVSGVRITGTNGNSIFIPVSGYTYPISYTQDGEESGITDSDSGYIMSGDSFIFNGGRFSYVYYFNSNSFYNQDNYRVGYMGFPIRPVR